jgi:hypothetical protein
VETGVPLRELAAKIREQRFAHDTHHDSLVNLG